MEKILCGLVLGAMLVPMRNVICKLLRKKQYPDWSDVPSQGRYVAMDENGQIKWFKAKPIISMLGRVWISGDGEDMVPEVDFGLLWKSKARDPLPPWRESLRQRPKE